MIPIFVKLEKESTEFACNINKHQASEYGAPEIPVPKELDILEKHL